jgi:hypothetical protein
MITMMNGDCALLWGTSQPLPDNPGFPKAIRNEFRLHDCHRISVSPHCWLVNSVSEVLPLDVPKR